MLKTFYLTLWISLFSLFPFNVIYSAQTIPKVVTTLHPLGLIAAEIIGTDQSITVLVPAGSSPHHYQLKPSNVKALDSADLVIWVGGSLELFMTKVVDNLSPEKTITLERLPDIKILHYRSSAIWKTDTAHQDHDHHGVDGHLWLSPDNAVVIARAIANHLAVLYPENKTTYLSNLDGFTTKIGNVDKANRLKLAPYAPTPFLVYHDAFQYFESHYELNSLGTFITESTQSLSAKKLSDLNKLIISSNIKCIFTDRQYDPSVAIKIAAQTGAHVVTLDPLGSSITYQENGYTRLLETISENMISCFSQN